MLPHLGALPGDPRIDLHTKVSELTPTHFPTYGHPPMRTAVPAVVDVRMLDVGDEADAHDIADLPAAADITASGVGWRRRHERGRAERATAARESGQESFN